MQFPESLLLSAKVQKRSAKMAPIIQCPDEIVKGFLRPEVNQCEYEILKSQSVTSSWGAKMAPIIPHPWRVCQEINENCGKLCKSGLVSTGAR